MGKSELPDNGCFYPPTLITEVDPACQLMQEEIFGPVLVGTTFRTPAEAVALANNTRYGLAASIWTENINLALDIAPKIVCGVGLTRPTNSMLLLGLRQAGKKRFRTRRRMGKGFFTLTLNPSINPKHL